MLCTVIAFVTFWSRRGLVFHGGDGLEESRHNENFLCGMSSQSDPYLAKHIEDNGKACRGKISYLSSTIYEEFIQIMADKVKHTIVSEL